MQIRRKMSVSSHRSNIGSSTKYELQFMSRQALRLSTFSLLAFEAQDLEQRASEYAATKTWEQTGKSSPRSNWNRRKPHSLNLTQR